MRTHCAVYVHAHVHCMHRRGSGPSASPQLHRCALHISPCSRSAGIVAAPGVATLCGRTLSAHTPRGWVGGDGPAFPPPSRVRYSDPAVKEYKLNIERNNGRAAMMGIIGMMIHEKLTGKPFVCPHQKTPRNALWGGHISRTRVGPIICDLHPRSISIDARKFADGVVASCEAPGYKTRDDGMCSVVCLTLTVLVDRQR